LVAALRRILQGTAHQRCRVHFARNLLALVPKSHKDMVADVFRTIFAQPDAATVANTWDSVRDQLAAAFPKIGPLMDEAKTEVLAFTAFPRSHWPKVWSTNPLERVNKEIKRRAPWSASSPTSPPSSASSAPSWPTCTTNGRSATAATYPKAPWPNSNRPAIMKQSPQSQPATRHRGSLENPPRHGTQSYFADERTAAGVRKGCFFYFQAFPDLHISLDEFVAEGDRVFLRSTMTGTHDGECQGIPATGRHIAVESAEVYRVANGKFVGYWCMVEVAGLMRQLTEEPVAARA
jgi:predicted ester cyclase